MTDRAGPTGVVSPEVWTAASSCPYIQRVVAEVGDAQLVSNSLGPFLTLASKTSLADPIGSAGFGAAEEAAAAAAAADAAAEADAEEAAERAARRDTAGPGGQAPSSPQPPETPEGRHSHGGGPAAAGTTQTPASHTEPSSCDVCHVDPAEAA
ncbi:hypothetical protein WJX75_005577 [Coccomyxa subellipsoidea]|uniref:Uncharacterized protein n=1 Tax=Coccomyxa subellipsoidea TaxID=248742 RepID=A0ABR2YB46_9CHLO